MMFSEIHRVLLKSKPSTPTTISENWRIACILYSHHLINPLGKFLYKFCEAIEYGKLNLHKYPTIAHIFQIPPPTLEKLEVIITHGIRTEPIMPSPKVRYNLKPLFQLCLSYLPLFFLLKPITLKPGTSGLINFNLWLSCCILLNEQGLDWYSTGICGCTIITFYNMRVSSYTSPPSSTSLIREAWNFITKPMECQSLKNVIAGDCYVSILSKLRIHDLEKLTLLNVNKEEVNYYPYNLPTSPLPKNEQFSTAWPTTSDDIKKRQWISGIKSEWNLGVTRKNCFGVSILLSFWAIYLVWFSSIPEDGGEWNYYIHLPRHMIPSFREGYIFYIIYTLTLNLTSPSILNLLSLGYFFSKGLNVTRFNEGKFLNGFFEVSDRLLNLAVNKLGWPMSPRVSLWLGNIITHGVWIPLILVFLLEICEIKLFNSSTFYDKVNTDTGLQLTPDEVYEIKGRVVEDAMDEWQGINGCKWFWRGERRLGEVSELYVRFEH